LPKRTRKPRGAGSGSVLASLEGASGSATDAGAGIVQITV
jgi:hypothetical protein